MSWQKVANIGADGLVSFTGFDYEGRKIRVHKRTAHHLVVRVEGGSGWASVGEREYRPAQFEVYDIVGGSGSKLTVEPIIDFPIRAEKEPPPDVSRRKFGRRYP